MKLLEKVARHPISVLMVFTAIFLFGAVSLTKLKVELLPAIKIPVASVVTEYSSLPALEVEQLVTIPLEDALSSVKGVKEINSTTKQGLSSINLRFDWGTNIDKAAVEIREKVDSTYPFLPYGLEKPLVFTEDLSEQPLVTLAVFPKEGGSLPKISEIIQRDLKTRLLLVHGVSTLRVIGATKPEVMVEVDAEKLYAGGLSLQQVVETISANIFEYPAGKVTENELEYLVKAGTGITSIEDIKNLPVRSGQGSVGLRLSDVAEIYSGIKDTTSFFHVNGESAVGILIYKTGDAGTLNASNSLISALSRIRHFFGNDLNIMVVQDAAGEIRSSALSLIAAIGLGIFSCFLVLVLIFKNTRAPFIIITSIPFSIASVFLFMYAAGISINIISLSGIAIGIGMIVDNSIVVLENLLKNSAYTPEQISAATLEMGSSTFGSTITTLLVFLPILFVPGITGALFKELALTISFLLFASFILSLTLTPALYGLFLAEKAVREAHRGRRMMSFNGRYRQMIVWVLNRPAWALSALLLITGLGIFLFMLLPKEVMPRIDKGQHEAAIVFPKGIGAEEASKRSKAIEKTMQSLPDLQLIYAEAGYDPASLKDRSEKGREISVVRMAFQFSKKVKSPLSVREEKISAAMRRLGVHRFKLAVPKDTVKKVLNAEEGFQFLLLGADRDNLASVARGIVEELLSKQLIKEAEIDTVHDSPEYRLDLSRDSLAYSALQPVQVLDVMETAVKGRVVSQLRTDEEETDIRVRLKRESTDSVEDLNRMRIRTQSGFVELGSIGSFSKQQSYGEIYRHNREMAVRLTFLPQPGKQGSLRAHFMSLQKENRKVVSENALANSIQEIGLVFLLAVTLMYLILAAQFESFGIPLLLFVSLPLSMTGSLLFLYLTGKSININSFLGILILLGTTINTSIILCVSFRSGTREEIIAGCLSRLKPITATVATTVVALLPIAANPNPANVLQSNTAVPVIGGLLIGTATTLAVFPALYWYFGKRRLR